MADRDRSSFPGRAHFMAFASRAMRGFVIDYGRNRRMQQAGAKRGGEFHITGIDTSTPAVAAEGLTQLEALGEALESLSARPMNDVVFARRFSIVLVRGRFAELRHPTSEFHMFNVTRHFRHALQPLVRCALDLDPSERLRWLNELRADCPTVAREMERLMQPTLQALSTFDATSTPRDVVPGSLEHLGLRC